jgi:signal transduction histidine kinase/DNA-binding response OmpR family regulator
MKPLGIKVKVALATSITSVVMIVLVTAFQTQRMREDFTQVLFHQQTALVNRTAVELDDKLTMLLDIIALSARRQPVSIANDSAALRAYYQDRAILSLFDDVLVLDKHGIVIADLPEIKGRVGINASDRAYFRKVMATRKPLISEPVLGRAGGQPLVQMVAPVLDEKGEVQAVLLGVLRLYKDNLLGHLRHAKVGRTGYYFAVTRSDPSLYVLHPDPTRLLQPRPGNANTATTRALHEGFEGTIVSTNSHDVEALTSYKKLRSADWVLAALLPMDEAFEPFNGLLLRLALWSVGASLAAALLIGWITLRLMEPLGKLRKSIQSLHKKPEQFTPIPITSQDEIGELTGAFNALMEDRLAAEAEAERARDRAEAANRAKSDFVANMSHEIRTPMNAVLGMAYLLGNTSLTAQQRKYLNMIRTSGQSLLGILNDVLDFSKIEARRMELAPIDFDLDDTVGTLATTMTMSAGEKELELAIVVHPEVPALLHGDALRLQQILVNLAGNAIKFTEHGEVVVAVSVVSRTENRALLRFEVRDTGIGMTEQQQAQLFNAFSQGDESITRRFGGTGLGLAITKRLIEMMGGMIALKTEAGKGSCFSFELWFEVLAQETDGRRRPLMGPLSVLVADDNRTSREMIVQLLRAWGWDADDVSSGTEALQMFSSRLHGANPYDIVLADWHMPGMDGLATAKSIRQAAEGHKQPIVVMVNAFARDQIDAISGAPEADVVLVKPITSSSLFDALHQALSHGSREDVSGTAPLFTERLKGVHFLLVEDNLLNQAVARGILEHAGATLDVVGDGQQAVDLLRSSASQYNIVLMDMQMPVLDGFSATRMIRDELKLSLPVIAMTAGVLAAERNRCEEAGISDFIAKPVVVEEMMAIIERNLPGRGNGSAGAGARSLAETSAGSSAAEAPAAPPVDKEPVFNMDSLMKVMGKDTKGRAVMFRMVHNALDAGLQPADEADRALREGRVADAGKIFHSLRGAVGVLGAKRLVRATLEAEAGIKEVPPDALPALFAAVRGELEQVLDQGRAWLDGEENVEAPR